MKEHSCVMSNKKRSTQPLMKQRIEILVGLVLPARQARPGCRMNYDFWPAGQTDQVRPGQATGQARPKKSGLLAALVYT